MNIEKAKEFTVKLEKMRENITNSESLKEYLKTKGIALIVCEKCSTMIEVDDIEDYHCKVCSEPLIYAKEIS